MIITGQNQKLLGLLARFVFLVLTITLISCEKASKTAEETPLETQDKYIKPQSSSMVSFVWHEQTRLENIFQEKLKKNKFELTPQLEAERDRVYFTVNTYHKQFLEQAIKEYPKNPANYVAYGAYLRPRRGFYKESLKYFQKAVDLDPTNPAYHFLLAHAYSAPLKSGEYTREGVMDEVAYSENKDKFHIEIDRARKLMPDNSFLDYFKALVIYDKENDLTTAWDLILEGNSKVKSYFIFPPPLPHLIDAWDTSGFQEDYIGLQYSYGYYPEPVVISLVNALLESEEINSDPEKIFEVMRFLYRMGLTRPFDRIHHYLMGLALEKLYVHYGGAGDPLKLEKIKEIKRLYDGISSTLGTWVKEEVKGIHPIKDPKNFLEHEEKIRRVSSVLRNAIELQRRLLKQVRDLIGLSAREYPLHNLLWKPE